jgi:hypothetical protein
MRAEVDPIDPSCKSSVSMLSSPTPDLRRDHVRPAAYSLRVHGILSIHYDSGLTL